MYLNLSLGPSSLPAGNPGLLLKLRLFPGLLLRLFLGLPLGLFLSLFPHLPAGLILLHSLTLSICFGSLQYLLIQLLFQLALGRPLGLAFRLYLLVLLLEPLLQLRLFLPWGLFIVRCFSCCLLALLPGPQNFLGFLFSGLDKGGGNLFPCILGRNLFFFLLILGLNLCFYILYN